YAYRGPMTVTISDNEIANGSDGIYCRSDVDSSSQKGDITALISGNEIHHNSGRGIRCYAHQYYSKIYPEIRANRIYSNGGDGISCGMDSVPSSYGLRMTPVITLNTVIDNAGRGIFCRATAAADIFYN
ncbi:hypothetical protein D1BOALGB6SA_9402, partial [Olavius sp. associated proteobacterium Delta 1]